MLRSIKISDEEMNFLREEARIYSCLIAGQAERWLDIGRGIERSPNLNYQHIRNALSGSISPDELSAEEQEIFFDEFSDTIWEMTPEQELAFQKQLGLGKFTGLNDNNKLIYQQMQDKD